MKKQYLLFLLPIIFLNTITAKISKSGNGDTNLGIVTKNIDAGIKAYNIIDLKYHADLSKQAIESVIEALEATDCTSALDLSISISTYLDTALLADDLASGRTYLYMAEELIVKTFYEYELCNTLTKENNELTQNSNNQLSDLEQQQAKLKQQQAELEQQANEIKRKLAEQQVKKSLLEKEQFITLQDKTIVENIKNYNDLLKTCDCNTTVNNSTENKITLSSKTIEELKAYYLNKIIRITENHLQLLNTCKK
ncbi:hypothetical protein [Lacinutrix sp. MEBiC02595]